MTGEVAWKSEAHRLGLWHRCFHCWIVAPETSFGGPYLFVQRRAVGKETWPDRLDVTVGGTSGLGRKRWRAGCGRSEKSWGFRSCPRIHPARDP
jgi:isopentenyldiphosphate isomerase